MAKVIKPTDSDQEVEFFKILIWVVLLRYIKIKWL